jgi:hypothetical protein
MRSSPWARLMRHTRQLHNPTRRRQRQRRSPCRLRRRERMIMFALRLMCGIVLAARRTVLTAP